MALSFALSDEQRRLRALVASFADEVIAPAAEEINAEGRFPAEIVRRMGEMGLFGIPFERRWGGGGGDLLTLCVALEEIGRVDQSVGITLEAGVGLGAAVIHEFGTEEQKQRWLPPLCRGERLAAFALTEAGGGSDLRGATRTRARLEGDHWIINGTKTFITNSGTEMTSVCTVTAWTGEDEMSAFVVPADTPGYEPQQPYRKVGWHASDTREIVLRDVRVPEDHLLGERGGGLRQFLSVLEGGRIALAALAVGLIRGCVEDTVRHANERVAFGEPIGRRQGVAFPIVDMEVAARAARNLYYEAAWRRGEGLPHARVASVAKLYASEQAVAAARAATQILGARGFMAASRVGRFYQDAKMLEIGEGTSEIQRVLIARDLGLGG